MMWQFAALLLGALVLSMALSLWQHRAYLAEVNAIARAHAGQDLRLVSGRSQGRLKGVVVVFLIDPTTRNIVEARAMTGATIFSRLRSAPELCGPMDTMADRATTKQLKKAANSALEMLPAGPRATPHSTSSTTGRATDAATGRITVRTPRHTTAH